MTFGDINRGLWPTRFEPRSATLFGYPINNYWHTNFPRVQQGDYTFRYTVTSAAELASAALGRLGREGLTPLEVGELAENDKRDATRGTLPATAGSFLTATGAELEALAPAEDGNGIVARLVETSGAKTRVRLAPGLLTIAKAWRCNAVQENQAELAAPGGAVEFELGPYAIATVRLQLVPQVTGR
jgi:alpha-mannosidase